MSISTKEVRLRVGRKVRYLRRVLGLKQEQLATFVGNRHKHIGQIERGQVNVTLDILTRIAACLSVDISELFRRPADEPGGADLYLLPRSVVERVEEALRAVERVARKGAPPAPTDTEPRS